MPDDMDIAQAINEEHQSDAIAEHFRRGIRNAARISADTCAECGEEIPEARRKAVPGCNRCVSCQSTFELLKHWR